MSSPPTIRDADEWTPTTRAVAWLIIGVGAILRFRQYAFTRSLWLDEAFLSLQTLENGWHNLFDTRKYGQAAPPVFLLLQKSAITLLGPHEWSLRLVPFAASVAALILFYHLSKRLRFGVGVTLLGLAIMALSFDLAIYASQAKQYSSDVAATLLSLLAAAWLMERPLTNGRTLAAAALGAAVTWCSHPSVFVLAGAGSVALIWALLDSKRQAARVFAATAAWGVSFIIQYFLLLREIAGRENLRSYWEGNFLVFPPRSASQVANYFQDLVSAWDHPGGFEVMAPLAMTMFIMGLVWLWASDRKKSLLLAAPLVVLLAASALGKYPLAMRLGLFTVPLLVFLTAQGADLTRRQLSAARPALGVAFIMLLLLLPFYKSAKAFAQPSSGEDIYPVMRFVDSRWKPGDRVCLYDATRIAYEYYRRTRPWTHLQDSEPLTSLDVNDAAMREWVTTTSPGQRTWIVCSHVKKADKLVVGRFFAEHSHEIDHFQTSGAMAYLYGAESGTIPPSNPSQPPPEEQ